MCLPNSKETSAQRLNTKWIGYMTNDRDLTSMNSRKNGTIIALIIFLTSCSPAGDEAKLTPEKVLEVTEDTALVASATNDIISGFIPAAFDAPVLIETEKFKIVPLGPELVKIDFDAYMSSIEHLQKTFTRSTNWPRKNISDADALLDMETEQARFENRESFAYAVLTPDGSRELGCVYVYPSSIEGYDAIVRMWVTKAEYDAGFDEELYQWVSRWVEADWPFETVAYPGRAIEWDIWDALVAEHEAVDAALKEQNRKTAEGFIDAFYSFDPEQLQSFLNAAPKSALRISYYQGWAEGGNYKVLNRGACEPESSIQFNCPITVQDDPVVALNTGFNVTDTFHITFIDTNITSIKTSSDDQPIYFEARKWVEANMPEVMTGPCLDRNNGGKTPGDCARAMTEGYKQFYAATRESTTAI
ncbi:MAG: hypothetical protein ACJAVI_003432 [Candidatus Azotimanducaceae bacterium]|jgi:hypothetical protein